MPFNAENLGGTAGAAIATGGTSLLYGGLAILASNVVGALAYKEPKHEYTAQEKAFENMVFRYRGIGERRAAAIGIASGISGLPPETFYGRRGQKLMGSNVTTGFTSEKEKEEYLNSTRTVKSTPAQYTAPVLTPVATKEGATTYEVSDTQIKQINAAIPVKGYGPTYEQAMSNPEVRERIAKTPETRAKERAVAAGTIGEDDPRNRYVYADDPESKQRFLIRTKKKNINTGVYE